MPPGSFCLTVSFQKAHAVVQDRCRASWGKAPYHCDVLMLFTSVCLRFPFRAECVHSATALEAGPLSCSRTSDWLLPVGSYEWGLPEHSRTKDGTFSLGD